MTSPATPPRSPTRRQNPLSNTQRSDYQRADHHRPDHGHPDRQHPSRPAFPHNVADRRERLRATRPEAATGGRAPDRHPKAGPLSQTELLRSIAAHSVRTVRGTGRLPKRVVAAIAVTVGAVILLGVTSGMVSDDDAQSVDGTDCQWLTHRVTTLSPTQERNAKIITVVARANDLGVNGATIAVAASMAESNLLNLANDGTSTLYDSLKGRQLTETERSVARRSLNHPHDEVGNNLDSVGLFQQRPMSGWGPPEVLIDPAKSAGLFFSGLARVPSWRTMSPWDVAQAVQGSPSTDGEIYRASYTQAVDVVSDVTHSLTDQPMPPELLAAISGGHC